MVGGDSGCRDRGGVELLDGAGRRQGFHEVACNVNGPSNLCPSDAVALCLAPLAPVASLAPGACRRALPPCDPDIPPTNGIVSTFPASNSPLGIAFDGASTWVANSGSNHVTVLRPNGTQTFDLPAGGKPLGIAFDGKNMWVTTDSSDVLVLSLPGATLRTVDTTPMPVDPSHPGPANTNLRGIAFDGTNMWVTSATAGTVTVLDPNGAILNTVTLTEGALGIAFDGKNMWVANQYDGTVSVLDPKGVPVVPSFTLPSGPSGTVPHATGIAFDGESMWVSDDNDPGSAIRYSTKPSSIGTQVGSPSPVGTYPSRIAFDGANMWVTNFGSADVTELSLTGAKLDTFTVCGYPTGIAFDGTHMWVANFRNYNVDGQVSGDGYVTEL